MTSTMMIWAAIEAAAEPGATPVYIRPLAEGAVVSCGALLAEVPGAAAYEAHIVGEGAVTICVIVWGGEVYLPCDWQAGPGWDRADDYMPAAAVPGMVVRGLPGAPLGAVLR